MSCKAATAAKAAMGADKAAYQAAKTIASLCSIQVQRGWHLALPGDQHKVPLGPEDYKYPPFLKRYGGWQLLQHSSWAAFRASRAATMAGGARMGYVRTRGRCSTGGALP
jgi:hypothetical protein